MEGKEVEIETDMERFSLKKKAYIRWESLNRQSFIKYFKRLYFAAVREAAGKGLIYIYI